MKIYWYILQFNALVTIKAYPLDTVLFVIKRVLETIFIMFFWYLVSKDTSFDLKTIISYFLISGGVSEVIMINRIIIGGYIRNMLGTSELANFFIKPINSIFYLYFTILGYRAVITVIAIINIIIGIVLSGNVNLKNLLLFIIYLFIASVISIAVNFLFGAIFIITNTSRGLLSVADQIIKVLSGTVIPLKFFPSFWFNILSLLPFSFMVTMPTVVFTKTFSTNSHLQTILIGILWAVSLLILSIFIWRNTLKSYEAYGI